MEHLTREEHDARAALMGCVFHDEYMMYFKPGLTPEGYNANEYLDAETLEALSEEDVGRRIRLHLDRKEMQRKGLSI